MTFDEIMDLYDTNPTAFLETVLAEYRYECACSPHCANCLTWGKLTGTPRLVTRKEHDALGSLPWPHRFEVDIGFYLVSAMNEQQVRQHVKRLRRCKGHKNEDHADLLGLYYREKFGKRKPVKRLCASTIIHVDAVASM
jgi:hypothetical protein